MLQSFLPVVGPNKGSVVGVVGITSTAYTGNETSVTLSGKAYDLIKIEHNAGRTDSFFYMAVQMEHGAYSRKEYSAIAGFIPIAGFLVPNKWITPQGNAIDHLLKDQAGVMTFLKSGGSVVSLTPPVLTQPSASNGAFTWNLTGSFIGRPMCSFIDIDWVNALNASSGDYEPSAISVGTPSPGSITDFIRAYIVQMPGVQGTRITYRNIRFVKISAVDPTPGVYTYPCVISTHGAPDVQVNLLLTVK